MSWESLTFGTTNIVGNFGTILVDQLKWRSINDTCPSSDVVDHLLNGN
jgi:hypothetical protein